MEILVVITSEISGVEYWELIIFLFSGTTSSTVTVTWLAYSWHGAMEKYPKATGTPSVPKNQETYQMSQ